MCPLGTCHYNIIVDRCLYLQTKVSLPYPSMCLQWQLLFTAVKADIQYEKEIDSLSEGYFHFSVIHDTVNTIKL